ncbi:low temperature requirement protein A [Micromonospora sp. 15K316]|uniref:low temperature requirement protein A n=1 Tax=Micromonospora sp. 15K316 TaxID=2530376 RepID=UPI0010519288|nr:low temperature requirement protein A [Micromonospora sp. 15K316]TDC39766.1 low temperature requirement protein A [Micromonospora sp. 15K316]
MTRSNAAELVRKAGDPQRATFLELFFDLVFVLALTQLSRGLTEDLGWSGAFRTLVLLGAMWWIWSSTAWLTDRTDPQRPLIQTLVIATMVGGLVMAAAVPEAYGDTGLIFAGAYVAIQLGRGLVLIVFLRGHELQRIGVRGLFWYGLSALPWIAGALVDGTVRGALWALAVVLDHTAGKIGFPTPGAGRTPSQDLVISGEHLAERYQQFFIIALGDMILVTGLALGGSGFASGAVTAFAVSIATTVLLWRIYIYRAGQVLAEAIAVSADPVRLAGSASYAHLGMVAGVVAAAVGAELVIADPFGHTPPAWIAVILGGPALYVAGRARFEHAVFGRVSRSRPIGVLALAALTPAMLPLPPVVVAAAAALVLAGIAISDAARARRRPSEPPSPPG